MSFSTPWTQWNIFIETNPRSAGCPVAEPDPVDLHVGRVIRDRREARNMTLQQLGAALDLTYQQIQKYEQGLNRVSASKLFQISAVLGTPINAFFEGLNDTFWPEQVDNSANDRAAQAIALIPDASVRQRIRKLIEALDPLSR